MSQSTRKAHTWTPDEPTAGGRYVALFWLFVAIAAVLFLFWKLWPSPPPKIYAASINLTKYEKPFTSPKFGDWSTDNYNDEEFGKRWEQTGVQLWEFALRDQLQNIEIKNLPEKISAKLAGKLHSKSSLKDTLVLHLRCLSAVSADPEKNLSLGILAGEEGSLRKRSVSFSDFFNGISKLPFKDIIVLADICDLQRLPSEGLFDNPIAKHLEKSLADAWKSSDESKKTPHAPDIWVMCAADDGQTPLHSDVLKKTLFECCFLRSLNKSDDSIVSLQECFDAIKTDMEQCSGGLQTPVLIHGNPKKGTTSRHDSTIRHEAMEKKASDVILAYRTGRPPESAKSDEKPTKQADDKADTKNANLNRSILTRVRFTQPPPTPDSDSEKMSEAPKGSNPTEKTSPTDGPKGIWGFRDALKNRVEAQKLEPSGGMTPGKFRLLSPSVFAPELWRRYQLSWARETPQDSRILESFDRYSQGLPSSLVEENKLIDPWKRTTEELKDTWLEPNPNALQQSKTYNQYAEYSSELLFWRDLLLDFPIEANGSAERIEKDFDSLVTSLGDARTHLPISYDNGYRDWKDFKLSDCQESHNQLRKWLDDEVKDLKSREKLHWVSERRLQVLLLSPLLTAEQRTELENKKNKITDENYDHTKNPGRFTTRHGKGIVKKWTQNIHDRLIRKDDKQEAVKDESWGFQYWEQIKNLKKESLSGGDAIFRWHLATFTDLEWEENSQPALILPALDPMGIKIDLLSDRLIDVCPKESVSSNLSFKIRRYSSDPMTDESTNLQYKLELQPPNSALKIKQKGTEIKPGSWRDWRKSNASEEFLVVLQPNEPVPVRNQTVVVTAQTKGKNNPSIQKLEVVYDKEKLGLLAFSGGSEIVPKILKDPSVLRIPIDCYALEDAKKSLRFSLKNYLDKKRMATVKIYYIPKLKSKLSMESWTLRNDVVAYVERSGSIPILESEKIEVDNNESKEISWKKSDPKTLSRFLGEQGFLAFEIVHDPGSKRPSDFYLGEINAKAPNDEFPKGYLEVTDDKNGSTVQLNLQTSDDFWRDSESDKLEVKALLQDGKRIETKSLVLVRNKKNDKIEFSDVQVNSEIDVTIGGYPRALRYIVLPERLEDNSLERTDFDKDQPLKVGIEESDGIGQKEIVLLEERFRPKKDSNYFIPNFFHPTELKDGNVRTPIRYRSLFVKCHVDLGRGSNRTLLQVQNSDGESLFDFVNVGDRSFWAQLSSDETDSSKLCLRLTPDEVHFDVSDLLNNVKEEEHIRYELSLITNSERQIEEPKKLSLIRDRKQPMPPKVEGKQNKKNSLPAKFALSKDVMDNSEIVECYFGVGLNNERSFAELASTGKVLRLFRSRTFQITQKELGDDFTSYEEPVRIFVRSIDECGNYQDQLWDGEAFFKQEFARPTTPSPTDK